MRSAVSQYPRTRAGSKKARLLLLLFLAMTPARHVLAQQGSTGTIRGVVTETSTRTPVPGAQVFLKGTTRGTLTNANGVYVLTGVAPGQATVRVESIGFRSTERIVSVQASQTVSADFSVQQSAIGLDELVVTGTAGRTTTRALGNSVAKVSASTVTEAVPTTNVQQLLQGRAAGVTLSTSSGVTGGSSRIRVRGAGSINASNEPVVYVDGIRVQSGTHQTSTNSTTQGLNFLEAFNPNDIESVEIIKGPAAATLYGADAAAGVIQIITKKGRPQQGLQWNARAEFGSLEWADKDAIETYWLCTDAQIADKVRYPGCQIFTTATPLEQRVLVDHPFNPRKRSAAVQKLYADNGWTQDYPCLFPQQQPCRPEPLRTGSLRNYNLAVRGGGEAYNFYISGEKNDQEGSYYNNFSNRKGVRANFGFVPSQKANFAVSTGYVRVNQAVPLSDNSSDGIGRNAFRSQAGGPSSQYLPGFRGMMPEFANSFNRQIGTERLTLGMTANYNPFGWWQNRLTVGLDRSDLTTEQLYPIDQTGKKPFGAVNATGSVSLDYEVAQLWTVDYNGTVTTNLSTDWSTATSAGMQFIKNHLDTHGISGDGLVANQLNLVSSAANRTAYQGFSEQTSLGFFVQEQASWRDRLFATAALRVDDNSAFGKDFSLVVYPKASLSYVISEEPYFHVPVVDELKLRAAWGQAGKVPAPFSADRTYTTGRAVLGDVAVNTLRPSSFGNPNLKAETGDELEFGFDATALRGRLGGGFTYYHKTTRDALLAASDPPSSGWSGTHLINVGEVLNTGVELSLNATPVRTKPLEWDITFAAATNHNKLVSFGRDAQGKPILKEDGFGAFATVYYHREGYPLAGLWATDVERDANGNVILDAAGRAKTVTCVWDPEDRSKCQQEFVGPSLPTRTIGLTNTFRILGNVRLYVFTDYQGGNYQWCAICSIRTRFDRNTKVITDPNLPKEEFARLTSLQTKEWIYPADFIKLREVSLTYEVPGRYLRYTGFGRASVTVSGRNLAIWTRYKGNSDPEVSFTAGGGHNGFEFTDYAAIPMQRRMLVSFNFGF